MLVLDLAVRHALKPDMARHHGFIVGSSVKPTLISVDMTWQHVTSQIDFLFSQDRKYPAFTVKMQYSMNALLRVLQWFGGRYWNSVIRLKKSS